MASSSNVSNKILNKLTTISNFSISKSKLIIRYNKNTDIVNIDVKEIYNYENKLLNYSTVTSIDTITGNKYKIVFKSEEHLDIQYKCVSFYVIDENNEENTAYSTNIIPVDSNPFNPYHDIKKIYKTNLISGNGVFEKYTKIMFDFTEDTRVITFY